MATKDTKRQRGGGGRGDVDDYEDEDEDDVYAAGSEQERLWSAVYDGIDANGDGGLSPAELLEGLRGACEKDEKLGELLCSGLQLPRHTHDGGDAGGHAPVSYHGQALDGSRSSTSSASSSAKCAVRSRHFECIFD